MTGTLKIQLHQEVKKMAGTGRGKLFESALERINELERQQSEEAARAVEGFAHKFKGDDSEWVTYHAFRSAAYHYANTKYPSGKE